MEMHDRILVSDATARRETGFNDGDKPDDAEYARRFAEKLQLAGQPAPGAPTGEAGMQTPAETTPQAPAAPAGAPPPEAAPAETAVAASGADPLLVAADLLVLRALERAGARLRVLAGNPHVANEVVHTQVADVSKLMDLDSLLVAAWDRAGPTAVMLGYDPEPFVTALDRYTRALLGTSTAHDVDRLAVALGCAAAV